MLSALRAALDGNLESDRMRQVVFITDGSVGNEAAMFAAIEQNLGDTRLFTVGIGSAPNSYFMRKAALLGRGTFTYINEVGEVGARMKSLFAKLENPVLTDIEVLFPEGLDVEVWPEVIPDLYLGEPVIVTARLEDYDGDIEVRAFCQSTTYIRPSAMIG